MKKTIFLVSALISINAYSQTTKPYLIEHCIDKMTDREYFLSTKNFVGANTQKTQGFVITPSFNSVNGKMAQNGFILKNIGIGNCDEGDSLIFLFEDDTKLEISMWNKFNCESKAYFNLTDKELELLKTKNITVIRFNNGYTYNSLTYNMKKEEKGFFVNVYTNNIVKEVKCDN